MNGRWDELTILPTTATFRLLTVLYCESALDVNILTSDTYEPKDDAQRSYLVIRDAVNGKTSTTSVDHIRLGEKSDQELCTSHHQTKHRDSNRIPSTDRGTVLELKRLQ